MLSSRKIISIFEHTLKFYLPQSIYYTHVPFLKITETIQIVTSLKVHKHNILTFSTRNWNTNKYTTLFKIAKKLIFVSYLLNLIFQLNHLLHSKISIIFILYKLGKVSPHTKNFKLNWTHRLTFTNFK